MSNRYMIFLILVLAGCETSTAPVPPPVSEACAQWPAGLMVGTSLSDELLDVVIDGQGRVYLAGYENGITGQATIDPSGNARGIVLKYGRHGELLSKLSLNTTGASSVEALALNTQTNELFLAGRTNGALAGFTNHGQFDLLAGWLHTDEWLPHLAQFGDARPQHPRRLVLGLSDELIIAGYDDLYVPTNYVEAWENPLLLKLARVGQDIVPVWEQSIDTIQSDMFNGLTVDSGTDGAIYVTGWNSAGAEQGIAIARYDSQGNKLWHRQLTGIGYDNGAALQILPGGHLLFAGSTFAQLGARSYGQMDIVVSKLDATTGNILWTAQQGSSETDWVTDMAVDANGNIYVVGETLGIVEPGNANPDMSAVFLLKLDRSGNRIMAKQWGSAGTDYPTAVAVDACENVFITGYTTGDLAGASNGGRDGFIIPVATQ